MKYNTVNHSFKNWLGCTSTLGKLIKPLLVSFTKQKSVPRNVVSFKLHTHRQKLQSISQDSNSMYLLQDHSRHWTIVCICCIPAIRLLPHTQQGVSSSAVLFLDFDDFFFLLPPALAALFFFPLFPVCFFDFRDKNSKCSSLVRVLDGA